MKRLSVIIGGIYVLVAVADIVFVVNANDQARSFSKPLLMPVLMLMYAAETGIKSSLAKIWLAALIFSWAGDIFLMFSGYFVQGLLAFLITHVLYIVYLLRINNASKSTPQQQIITGLPIIIFWVLMLAWLLPHLEELKLPVFIYTTVICIFWMLTLNLFGKTESTTARLLFYGATLFVISDSVLAINAFIFPHRILPVIVMSTYTTAQLLLALGSVRNLRITGNM